MTASEEKFILMHDFLENISKETDRLARVAVQLDGMVAALAQEPSSLTSDQFRVLQGMDALRQALEAISKIAKSAADDLPADANVGFAVERLAEGVNIQNVRDACLGVTSVQCEKGRGTAETVFF